MTASSHTANEIPAASASEQTDVVSICLDDGERIEFQKAAERCGLSLSQWIRDRLREAAKREAKEA